MPDARLELHSFRHRFGAALIDDLNRDLRYAVRQLGRSPGFAVVAILCLALGIGVTTAIYSVVNTILLQPLPFADSDQLVRVSERVPPSAPGRPTTRRGIPYRDVLDWREHARTLSDAAAVVDVGQRLVRTSHGAAGLWGYATSANAFTMLGVRAIVGRPFDATDAANPDVAVLTFDTWQRHFDADPHVVGSILELRAGSGQSTVPPRLLTIVGVLPADFEFPTGPSDFYTVLRPPDSPAGASPPVGMIGRIAPGVSLTAATDELNAIGAASRPPWPANAPALTGPRFELERLKDLTVRDLKPALNLFLAAVLVVLLIACANVANLLLARGTARQREIAVRQAIGASRGRLVRQIMAECLVLATAGGAAGALIGAAGVAMAKRLATVDAPGVFAQMFGATILPRAHEVRVDVTVFGIAFSIAAMTTVVFGLLPALYLSRSRQLLTLGSGATGSGPAASRTRELLVVAQLAMATVLLVGAGLLMRSFVRLSTNDKGYDASQVVALQLLFPDQYSTARKAETVGTMLTRLRQLPGVRTAGFARHGMLIGESLFVGTFVPPGQTLDEVRSDPVRTQVRSVSDGFLTAMDVPLLDGREFAPTDDAAAPPVIVINRTAARRLFGSTRAVGQSVNWYVGSTPVQTTVIGVVEDVRQESLAQQTFPEIYVDYRQLLAALEPWPQFRRNQNELAIGFLSFAIRTDHDPASLIPTIQRLVGVVDPNVGIDALVPMTRLVADSLARQRFATILLGAFAIAAGLLAAIGIYGVLAYLVAQRTSEIGIRMALGAQHTQVLILVLRKGLILTSIGIVLGLIGATTVTRLLQKMLFGVTPFDPTTFVAVGVLFAIVTTVASYVPARRATRVDPLIALKSE
jgi:putative ABC transport system permease protein